MEQDESDKPRKDETPAYYYADSGIEERHGHVPLWLWGVAAALAVWGVYYLVANWSPPG